MKLKGNDLSKYQTSEDQILVRISRIEEKELGSTAPEIPSFTMTNSSDKEVKKGVVVCSDEDHKNWEGKEVIIPIDGTIAFDTFVDIDDIDTYEYRLVKIKNVMLISK